MFVQRAHGGVKPCGFFIVLESEGGILVPRPKVGKLHPRVSGLEESLQSEG